MRTELAIATVLAAATGHAQAESLIAQERFTVALPGEVTLVGLTAGVRPEVLYRFGDSYARSRLRLAVGVLDGPEQLFVPISLGYRSIFRTRALVQPEVGAGLELQHRFVSDADTVRQWGFYIEGGVGFALREQLSVGMMAALDVTLYGGGGAGLGPRVFVSWRL